MQMGAWISYFVGARLVSLGELTTTTYVQLANSMWGFVGYVNHIMFQLPQILEIIVHVERVFEILESASLIGGTLDFSYADLAGATFADVAPDHP